MKTIEEIAKEYSVDSTEQSILIDGIKIAQRWIPVKEELPPIDIKVLVKCSTGNWTTSTLRLYANLKTSWAGSSTFGNSITHWRQLELK